MREGLLAVSPAHRNAEPAPIAGARTLAAPPRLWQSRRMIAHAETYRFSVEEYNKLGEAGIFHEDDRVELLNGEIILMAPIGKHHVKAVRRLNRILNRRYADLCFVDCQSPVVLDNFSEPQPDILLLALSIDETDEKPSPAETLLAIEVADSSMRYDSTTKLRAYAAAGIPEYWIVNLAEKCVEVYRQPAGETYAEHFRRERRDPIAPAAFPDRPIDLAEILD
jgi:Uma2 family endonuclease